MIFWLQLISILSKSMKKKINVRLLSLSLVYFLLLQLIYVLCVESAAKRLSENQKNSTVTDNNTISLSLSEEPVETLKDSVGTSSQVNYCLLILLSWIWILVQYDDYDLKILAEESVLLINLLCFFTLDQQLGAVTDEVGTSSSMLDHIELEFEGKSVFDMFS